MQKNIKYWLIAAIVLIGIGGIGFTAVMAEFDWNFSKLSSAKYETSEYILQESFQNISIKTNTADIAFIPTDNDKPSVSCYELENMWHKVSVKDGTLVIEVVDTREWYEYIGIFSDKPKITLHIPQGEYSALAITCQTGDITLPKELGFQSMDISNHTGDVTIRSSIENTADIKATTGSICVEQITAGTLKLSVSTGKITASDVICQDTVTVKVSTGKTHLTNIQCQSLISTGDTGDIHLKNVVAAETFSIKRDTGDVKFDSCDAPSISVETDTGDVTGSLKTEKVFLTETDTGRIDVPKSTAGGTCEIRTDTGDILIKIG